MSRRPPCVFTSRACAVSTTTRPVASCHLACTGTITGKRLLRRWSFFNGGVGEMSSSKRGSSSESRVAPVPFWHTAKNRTGARLITGELGSMAARSALSARNIYRRQPRLRGLPVATRMNCAEKLFHYKDQHAYAGMTHVIEIAVVDKARFSFL